MFASQRGRLLVATPELGDPNFERAVVLVLEHTRDGAVGVILNRPSGTRVSEAGGDWDGWEAIAGEPAVVFSGGPVAPHAVIAVGRGDTPDGFQPIVGDVGVVDLSQPPEGIGTVRLFAGYSGWGDGQLDDELAAGAWFTLEAWPGDALTHEPGELWRDVLRRQPGRLSLFAGFPPDPSAN